jgi:hypothetical protein
MLESLENLNSVGGPVYIRSNAILSSLIGLDSINPGTIGELNIFYNPNLSFCSVQSICDYLLIHNGTANIQDNAAGCNDQDEVEETCESIGVDEFINDNDISISPNPTRGIVDCQFSVVDFQCVSIAIFNMHGREVALVLDEKLPAGEHVVRYDMAALPEGVYFVKVTAGREVETRKILLVQ